MTWRFAVTLQRDGHNPLAIASGLIFGDGLTFLRWQDGTGAYGLYPSEAVLATINTRDDDAQVVIEWPDGDPREELAHRRAHEAGHEHGHE